MEVSKKIRDHIDRLIEQFQLEGRNILDLPGQLAAALAVEAYRKELPGAEADGADYSVEELVHAIGGREIWQDLLGDVTIVRSRQLRRELLSLAQGLLGEYPGMTLGDFSPLGGVMEYLLDAVFRKGNKNFFFTPANIARLMIGLVQPKGGTLWDPACGSGTFLVEAMRGLKAGDYPPDLFGTDINEQMIRIARINAFFHGIRRAWIVAGDALEEERRFDAIVANPPVSVGRGSDRLYGDIAPTTALHLQYLQMIPDRLTPEGRAAVLVNESVLFGTKRTETLIRQALVEQYNLRTVISLPRGIFAPYTNAKASILLFGGKHFQDEILFYELRRQGDSPGRKDAEDDIDIQKVLAVCAESDYYIEQWKMALQTGSTFNADGVAVPENWQEKDFWFADPGTVRGNGYVLLPGRYCPQRRREQEVQEDYRELLDRLLSLEQEAGEQMTELARIFQGDWM